MGGRWARRHVRVVDLKIEILCLTLVFVNQRATVHSSATFGGATTPNDSSVASSRGSEDEGNQPPERRVALHPPVWHFHGGQLSCGKIPLSQALRDKTRTRKTETDVGESWSLKSQKRSDASGQYDRNCSSQTNAHEQHTGASMHGRAIPSAVRPGCEESVARKGEMRRWEHTQRVGGWGGRKRRIRRCKKPFLAHNNQRIVPIETRTSCQHHPLLPSSCC